MLRNVWGTDITSERNVQGRTLQVRGMYSVQGTDTTSQRNVQGWTLQLKGM